MSDQANNQEKTIQVKSSRFGDVEVAADSLIVFPSGFIGFQDRKRFILLDHKEPFSWLQSVDDPYLAFVVVDGAEFGQNYNVSPPKDDKDLALLEGDEYAILVIVTVRPDPTMTTANLKAPLFVNLRNRQGVQAVFDHPDLSTRFRLWIPESEEPSENKEKSSSENAEAKAETTENVGVKNADPKAE
jgi:flagellar assembly factor FliW